MKLSHEEIAARLAASPEHDVCVLRIEEGDFGCEEHRDPPRLWLLTETAAGERLHHENTVFFDVFKRCELERAGIQCAVTETGDGVLISQGGRVMQVVGCTNATATSRHDGWMNVSVNGRSTEYVPMLYIDGENVAGGAENTCPLCYKIVYDIR